MVLILLERSLHNINELTLPRVVCLPNPGLDLMEPHLNGIELGRVGRQVHDLDIPFLSKIHGLLLVMNSAVIHNQPYLPIFFTLLV